MKKAVQFVARTLFVLVCITIVMWLAVTPWAWLIGVAGLVLFIAGVAIIAVAGLGHGPDDSTDQPTWLDHNRPEGW